MILQHTTRSINKSTLRQMSHRARQNQTFTLSDGRQLGYAEYGDQHGTPLLYFHGFPSCRLEAYPIDDMAHRQNVRLIALDRPGFGLSTSQTNRTISDWPKDVSNFTNGMRLSRFAILGLSGGGPYALACAHALPRQKLIGVGLFASGPPWAAGAYHMSIYRRVISLMAIYWPASLRAVLDGFVRICRWLLGTKPVIHRIDSWLEKEKEQKISADQTVKQEAVPHHGTVLEKTTPERRLELINALLDEPFVQGAEAVVYEAKLLSSMDWGFSFEDVEYKPMRIWHGAKDTNAPVAMIRFMVDRLPHCVYHEFQDDTHYTMYKHLERAIAEVISEGETKEQL